MAIILNIETATDVCSVCISKKDEVITLKEAEKEYSHTSKITLLIQQCCVESGISLQQLDAVAVSSGPGSYTSLRVGVSTAKGICYALDKPLIAVDTLESIARATMVAEDKAAFYAPMIDARRMEVYTSLFDQNGLRIQDTNAKIIDEFSFQEIFKKEHSIVFSGNGAPKCKGMIQSPYAIFSDVICSAVNLVPMSFLAYQENHFSDAAYFSPSYFKSPNITTPRKTL